VATARSHASADSGTHEGVLLSMLNEMDGVEELIGVTVIGATNRPEALVSYSVHPIFVSCRFCLLMLKNFTSGPSADASRKARSYFIRGAARLCWPRGHSPDSDTQHGRRTCSRFRSTRCSRTSPTVIVSPATELFVQTDGCSGAEITAMCQEAALIAMREDINSPYVSSAFLHGYQLNLSNLQVPQRAFIAAAKALKRQITPEMLQKFERWRDEYGVSTVA
jgi:AAA family ATPase